jgi:hypothetical protein
MSGLPTSRPVTIDAEIIPVLVQVSLAEAAQRLEGPG